MSPVPPPTCLGYSFSIYTARAEEIERGRLSVVTGGCKAALRFCVEASWSTLSFIDDAAIGMGDCLAAFIVLDAQNVIESLELAVALGGRFGSDQHGGRCNS
jgi:hypothetical protein